MKLRDITDAILSDDRETMLQAFRALVEPGEDPVDATSPGLLVVALNRLCAALKDDSDVMAAGSCRPRSTAQCNLRRRRCTGEARRRAAGAASDGCWG